MMLIGEALFLLGLTASSLGIKVGFWHNGVPCIHHKWREIVPPVLLVKHKGALISRTDHPLSTGRKK